MEREKERERTCTVKMLLKITIELGLKNRNPLFPELETIAVCSVVIRCVCRCVWEKERVTKSASPHPTSRDIAGRRVRTDTCLGDVSQKLLIASFCNDFFYFSFPFFGFKWTEPGS